MSDTLTERGMVMSKRSVPKESAGTMEQDVGERIILSVVGSRSQADSLDGICLAIRKAQPQYRVSRSELMRAVFAAALPIMKKCDWSNASDYRGLVAALRKAMRGDAA